MEYRSPGLDGPAQRTGGAGDLAFLLISSHTNLRHKDPLTLSVNAGNFLPVLAKSRSSAVVNCRKLRQLFAILPLRPTRAQGVREVGGYRSTGKGHYFFSDRVGWLPIDEALPKSG